MVRDPEVRAMPNGKSTVAFAVACDRDYKSESGERACDFVDCVAFAQQAEFIGKYFKKGKMILVSGRLQNRKFTTKDGQNRTVTEIYVDRVHFCGDAERDAGSRQQSDAGDDTFKDLSPDDIPF